MMRSGPPTAADRPGSAAALTAVVGLAGIWMRRRAGLWIFAASLPAALAFDILAGAWLHVPVALVSSALVFVFAWRVRGVFR